MNPILPRRVKTSELAIINPVWIDILANPEEFTQIKEIEAFQDVVFFMGPQGGRQGYRRH